MPGTEANLADIRVIEIADEQAEYCGRVLAGLGADVIKIEPPGGSPTRHIGPFYGDVDDPERSLFFWQYSFGKRSVVLDLEQPAARDQLLQLLAGADVLLESMPRGYLARLGLGAERLRERFPSLLVARISPFGDDGPWADYRASDLVHLALGGPMANSGYDPRPDGNYDLPPIAPQMWHAYHIAGEQMAIGILGALLHRRQTGEGQALEVAVHEAVSKNTELDLMSWVMRAAPFYRQTCRHAGEQVSPLPIIGATKDGRWMLSMPPIGSVGWDTLVDLLDRYGLAADLRERVGKLGRAGAPGVGPRIDAETVTHVNEVVHRLFRKFVFDEVPWREAQEVGLMWVPLRRPHENALDEHWWERGSFGEVEHPELGRSFVYTLSKWVSNEAPWRRGPRAPRIGEHTREVLAERPRRPTALPAQPRPTDDPRRSRWGKPFALHGVRVVDLTWYLASGGAPRFLSAMGAEVIKVEWHENSDLRINYAQAPEGGRAAREGARGPLPADNSSVNLSGQFNNKRAGQLGISLNVRHPKGQQILRRLIASADVVAEGFSPGVMERWGLGYEALRALKPDIIYAQQSGFGQQGRYGRYRTLGPVAQALGAISEMSGLPEPVPPAGWGYSYLDWFGAYTLALAILAALNHRARTGRGQWIDSSQCDCGIYLMGTAILDWSANGRTWQRYGNRSPYKPAAPHGAYRCAGDDAWLAIACFDQVQWEALAKAAGHPEWVTDARFATLTDRLAHQDPLDALVESWTRTQERYEAMARLQAAGVPAGVCQTAADRCERDPQLAHLGWLTEVTGTEIGTWPVAEVPVHMSATPPFIGGPIDRAAPCYGEDNERVYGGILGMSGAEIAALKQEGVI
jgi:crotonobetainyl-CoA:carnitine CoA-transferase CaiB-like acyl-CoA transferase